jgi:hypothetical protein
MLLLLDPRNEKLLQKKISYMKKIIFIKPVITTTLLQTAPSAAEQKAPNVSHNQSFISFIACYHVSVKVTSHH